MCLSNRTGVCHNRQSKLAQFPHINLRQLYCTIKASCADYSDQTFLSKSVFFFGKQSIAIITHTFILLREYIAEICIFMKCGAQFIMVISMLGLDQDSNFFSGTAPYLSHLYSLKWAWSSLVWRSWNNLTAKTDFMHVFKPNSGRPGVCG